MIKIAISPCPNDLFNFFGLLTQRVSFDQPLGFTKLPLHELNASYYKGEFDFIKVSSISHLLSPEEYDVCPLGGSLTAEKGPLVVAKKFYSFDKLSHLKFAVASKDSTAAILLKVLFDAPKIVVKPFFEIISSVQREEVDCGVVIHEGRLKSSDYNLVDICDLTKIWFDKYKMPTPLAVFVAKKTISKETVRTLMGALVKSYDYALEHKDEALEYCLKDSQVKDKEVVWEHVKNFSLYSHRGDYSTSEILASFQSLVAEHLSQDLQAAS